MSYIRALARDVPTTPSGLVNSHDHLFLRVPTLPGEELADAGAAADELARFARLGGTLLVQWTPIGLGRRLDAIEALSRRASVDVVAATGRHLERHTPSQHPIVEMSPEQLAERFVDDVVDRRCGVIKVATGYRAISGYERDSLLAAAAAHEATGAPVAVHLERGTAGDLVLDRLTAAGVDPQHVVLGHVGRHPDSGYATALAQSGAFLCFDGPSPAHHATDWRLLPLVEDLVAAGHGRQLLLGGDTTSRVVRTAGGGPGAAALFEQAAVDIERHLGEAVAHQILTVNPRAAWQLRA